MESSRKQRWRQLQSLFEPDFRRMLVVSFLLHLLLPLLYSATFLFNDAPVKPPAYQVNLVNMPVKNPQAGRPEATQVKKPRPKPKPKAKPKPLPPKPKPAPVKPKPVPVKPKPIPVKPEPTPKVEAKPAPKPEPKPAVSKAQEDMLQKRFAEMRAKVEKQKASDNLEAKIAALKAAAAAESEQIESPIENAPVGMLDGKGDEAGVAAGAFVQKFIQQQWSLSKYQVAGNPEAEAILLYSADGTLIHYRFVKKSGNSIFDESLTRAINKSKQLNHPLPEQMEFHIVFNLKDMLDQR